MITEQMLNDIAELVEQHSPSEMLLTQLRVIYPGVHFTYCMDDDIHSGRPVREGGGFRLYLVCSQDHCSQLTTAMASASGLVIAEVIDD